MNARVDLPVSERILLGPGPSLIAPRVMRALGAPMLSHLDPQFLEIMDDLRARLGRVFQAPEGAFTFAVSGTGTSGMETAVANLVGPGTRVLSVVTGYFADRLAQLCTRYGGAVTRVEAEWGRAIDPEAVRRALVAGGADIVTIVHAETSTGVLNPVAAVAAIAREHVLLGTGAWRARRHSGRRRRRAGSVRHHFHAGLRRPLRRGAAAAPQALATREAGRDDLRCARTQGGAQPARLRRRRATSATGRGTEKCHETEAVPVNFTLGRVTTAIFKAVIGARKKSAQSAPRV